MRETKHVGSNPTAPAKLINIINNKKIELTYEEQYSLVDSY